MSEYNWTRLWTNLGNREAKQNSSQNSDLLGDLYSTDSVNGHPISSYANRPCVVLLGEPGIGKSSEIRKAFNALNVTVSGDDKLFYPYDHVGGFDTIFTDEKIRRWLEGQHNLYLFIDSLDEEIQTITNIRNIISPNLKRIGDEINRLFIRVACRTTLWMQNRGLEELFIEYWGKDNLDLLELQPLQREDIETALSESEIDAEIFLSEIDRMNINSLATTPVTLESLIQRYKRTGNKLLSNQAQLYEDCTSSKEMRHERYFAKRHFAPLYPTILN